ncbi:MAG: hypothetical protein IJS41_00510 [Clostridia bacterium]|nr:hypothetical protein [Clostridia bacterium]
MAVLCRKKGIGRRLAALAVALFLILGAAGTAEMEAEAAGVAMIYGALSVLGGTWQSVFSQEPLDVDLDLDMDNFWTAYTVYITYVLLTQVRMVVYVADAAKQEGMKEYDFIMSRMGAFCVQQGITVREFMAWLLEGVSILQNGAFELSGLAASHWKAFLDFLVGEDAVVYPSSGDVPVDGYAVNGRPVVLVPSAYDSLYYYNAGGYYLSFCQMSDFDVPVYACILKRTGVDSGLAYFFYFSDGKLDLLRFKMVEPDGSVKYDDYSINVHVESNRLWNTSSYVSGIGSTTFPINSFDTNDEIYAFEESIREEDLVHTEGVDSALVGDKSAAASDEVISSMDALEDGKAVVLDPGILDQVGTDEAVGAKAIDIDNYADIIKALLDGIAAIDLPGIGSVSIPDIGVLDDADVRIGDKSDTGTKVIDDADTDEKDLVVTDIPGVSDALEGIVDWGMGYISPTKGILSKFPFSIPYDLYLMVAALSGDISQNPVDADLKAISIEDDLAPPGASYERGGEDSLHWDLSFSMPVGSGQVRVPMEVNLSDWAWCFKIIRYFTGILWLMGLLMWAREESN